jgi:2-(1,2-epoxy-1,2-dihydrophenyl)acetyl-CoA isomerase
VVTEEELLERMMDESMSDQVVTYESAAGIAVITLNRPHRLNAVVPELVERLCTALGQARHDDVAACVLTGAGRSFCAGHDLRQEHEPISEAEDRRRLHRIQDVTRLVRQAPFPVISAVHGYALGAGCEFALCCDLIVASADATFGFPEVSVGLGVTGGISRLLTMIVGLAKAKELVLLGERFSAEHALEYGLINWVVEPGQHLGFAMDLAARLRARPRAALARAKHALDLGPEAGIEAAFETEIAAALALHAGADAQDAARAFRDRGSPVVGNTAGAENSAGPENPEKDQ